MDCLTLEPCHTRDCDGLDEVVSLLPPGPIWQPDRGDIYGRYIHALGHIKTELNQRICQEWNELNPCTAKRLLPYWAKIYSLPECVAQTGAKLCEWIGILNGDCPIGSLGFYRDVIEFVAPGLGIQIDVKVADAGANCWCPSSDCADENPILITAPASVYYYEEFSADEPMEFQDGENCRRYFIPEIECIRRCVLPFGLGVGYKTTVSGPLGQDIFGVPEANKAIKPVHFINCQDPCPDVTNIPCRYLIRIRPDGEILVSENNEPLAFEGNWHDGTLSGSSYELLVENIGGDNPIQPELNTWISLSETVNIIYDDCSQDNGFNQLLLTIRNKNTQVVFSSVEVNQQLRFDYFCNFC